MLIYTQLQKAGTLVVIPLSHLFWEGCYLFKGVSSSTRDLHDGEVLCVQCVCVVYAWTLALSRISFLKTNPPSVLLLVPLSLSLSLSLSLFLAYSSPAPRSRWLSCVYSQLYGSSVCLQPRG